MWIVDLNSKWQNSLINRKIWLRMLLKKLSKRLLKRLLFEWKKQIWFFQCSLIRVNFLSSSSFSLQFEAFLSSLQNLCLHSELFSSSSWFLFLTLKLHEWEMKVITDTTFLSLEDSTSWSKIIKMILWTWYDSLHHTFSFSREISIFNWLFISFWFLFSFFCSFLSALIFMNIFRDRFSIFISKKDIKNTFCKL